MKSRPGKRYSHKCSSNVENSGDRIKWDNIFLTSGVV